MNETVRNLLFDPTVGKIVSAALAVIVVLTLSHLLQRYVSRLISATDMRYRTRKFINLLGYIVALFAITIVFQDKLRGLTVAFGVAGAGVAFALQEVIASVAGWIAISVGKFYAPGDRIELAGIKGDVIDITILRTTLMEVGEWVNGDLYSGRIVRVTNSHVFKEPVYNYSGDFPFLWDEITLPVRYGSDWKLARTMLRGLVEEVLVDYANQVRDSWKKMVHEYRIEDANVEPMITLRATDNWIEFTVRYVVDYRKRRWMKDHLFTRILEEIDKSGNQIRLASATFEVVPGSKLDVHLSGGKDSFQSDQKSS
ncbi:MAG: mechanosensitive ion channel [Acidobacteriota bacterium]|nr:mechanosensitive ion channel [Acidobacteriota bacterium]